MTAPRKAPNDFGFIGGGIRALHFGLNDLRRQGYDMTLGEAIDRECLAMPNGKVLTKAELGVETRADAVDRILKDIGLDRRRDTMEFAIKLPEDQRWIVPEIFLDPIEQGMRQQNDFYKALVAKQVEVRNLTFKQPDIDFYSIASQGLVAGGIGTTPQEGAQVTFSNRDLRATKFERKVNVPWEVQQFATLDQLSTFMVRLGKVWGLQMTRQAIDVLLNGDAIDTTLAPGTIGVEDTTEKVQWIDLTRILARGGRLGFQYTTVVTTEENTIHVVNLDEFKTPAFNGQPIGSVNIQGRMPNRWDYFMHSVIPSTKWIFLDPSAALTHQVAEGLRVEAENNMANDFTTTYVRMYHCFANLFRQARVVVDHGSTFVAAPWPAFMAPID